MFCRSLDKKKLHVVTYLLEFSHIQRLHIRREFHLVQDWLGGRTGVGRSWNICTSGRRIFRHGKWRCMAVLCHLGGRCKGRYLWSFASSSSFIVAVAVVDGSDSNPGREKGQSERKQALAEKRHITDRAETGGGKRKRKRERDTRLSDKDTENPQTNPVVELERAQNVRGQRSPRSRTKDGMEQRIDGP